MPTPGRRRGPKNDYLHFNARPTEVGSRTGRLMPTNVPLNEDGFEDPDEFFKSSPRSVRITRASSASMRTPRGGAGPSSSPRTSPRVAASSARSMRTRLSDLADDDEAEEIAADDLLHDEDDDRTTPPGPFFPSSPNPPPSVRVPRRSQLPPDSPSLSFDAIPSPSRTVRNARRTPHGVGTSLSQTQLNSPSDNDATPRGHDDDDATPRTRSKMLASGRAGTGSPLSSVQRRAEVRSSRREALFAGSDEVVMEEEGSVDITVDVADDSQPVHRKRGPAQVDEEDDDDGVPDTFEDAEDDMGPGIGDFGNGENDFDDSFSVEDTGLEEAAVAAEQDDDDEDDEQPVSPPIPKKRGRPSKDSTSSAKRQKHAPTPPSSRAKPRAKAKRVSGFPLEGEQQYTGDFKMRRSGRQHFKPLEYWRGERFEYKSGEHLAVIEQVLRKPASPPPTPKPKPRYTRKTSKRPRSASVDSNPEDGWDAGTNQYAVVQQFLTEKELQRRVVLPKHLLEPKDIKDADFKYQKVFGEGKFLASGIVDIPKGCSKPIKPSRENAYVFYVIKGAVRVQVHRTNYIAATGCQFMIPRGNSYGIKNISPHNDARLFFAQARKIRMTEDEEEYLDSLPQDSDEEDHRLETQPDPEDESDDGSASPQLTPPQSTRRKKGRA